MPPGFYLHRHLWNALVQQMSIFSSSHLILFPMISAKTRSLTAALRQNVSMNLSLCCGNGIQLIGVGSFDASSGRIYCWVRYFDQECVCGVNDTLQASRKGIRTFMTILVRSPLGNKLWRRSMRSGRLPSRMFGDLAVIVSHPMYPVYLTLRPPDTPQIPSIYCWHAISLELISSILTLTPPAPTPSYLTMRNFSFCWPKVVWQHHCSRWLIRGRILLPIAMLQNINTTWYPSKPLIWAVVGISNNSAISGNKKYESLWMGNKDE